MVMTAGFFVQQGDVATCCLSNIEQPRSLITERFCNHYSLHVSFLRFSDPPLAEDVVKLMAVSSLTLYVI